MTSKRNARIIAARAAYADDLPEQSEDEVWFAGVQVVGADVDDVAAYRLCRVERQGEVLVDLVDVQLAAVQRSLVDRARLRTVHHLTVKNRVGAKRLASDIFMLRRTGALSDTAISPSVCPSVCPSLGYRHAGCLQLAGHQICADCGPVRVWGPVRGRT